MPGNAPRLGGSLSSPWVKKHIGNRDVRKDIKQSEDRRPNPTLRCYWIKKDRYLQWAELLPPASDFHKGCISTLSRKEWERNSTCWNRFQRTDLVSVIHKGAATMNWIELCFTWDPVRHSGFATFFSPWINGTVALFEISIMFSFLTFILMLNISKSQLYFRICYHRIIYWPCCQGLTQKSTLPTNIVHIFTKLLPAENLKPEVHLYVVCKRTC